MGADPGGTVFARQQALAPGLASEHGQEPSQEVLRVWGPALGAAALGRSIQWNQLFPQDGPCFGPASPLPHPCPT